MRITFLYAFILLFCAISCTENVRVININDFQGEGSYLPIKSGQKFTIEMEGNPTTGYSWFLENTEKISKELITPLNLTEKNSGEYYTRTNNKNENEEQRVGGGGIYHFKFEAHPVNSGSEILTFVYKRPWTEEGEIRKSVNVKIVNPHDNRDL